MFEAYNPTDLFWPSSLYDFLDWSLRQKEAASTQRYHLEFGLILSLTGILGMLVLCQNEHLVHGGLITLEPDSHTLEWLAHTQCVTRWEGLNKLQLSDRKGYGHECSWADISVILTSHEKVATLSSGKTLSSWFTGGSVKCLDLVHWWVG